MLVHKKKEKPWKGCFIDPKRGIPGRGPGTMLVTLCWYKGHIMQQKFHVSLSTRPPHISCNLFSLFSLCHWARCCYSSKRGIFSCKQSSKTIQNSKIPLKRGSIIEVSHYWGKTLGDKDLQGGGGGGRDTNILEEGCLTEHTWMYASTQAYREYPHRCDCVIPNPFCNCVNNWSIEIFYYGICLGILHN